MEFLVLADQALRRLVGRFEELAQPAESPMETRLRWLLLRAGLPPPQVQANLHDAGGLFVGRADLYYPSARLVIEYDGANHRDRLAEDNRRQNAILAAGFNLLRFTAADLAQRPDGALALVRGALNGQSRRCPGPRPPRGASKIAPQQAVFREESKPCRGPSSSR